MSDRSSCRIYCAPQDADILAREILGQDEAEPDDCLTEESGVFIESDEVVGGGECYADDFHEANPSIPFILEGGGHWAYDPFLCAYCSDGAACVGATVDGTPVVPIDEDTGEPQVEAFAGAKRWAKFRAKAAAEIAARVAEGKS